MATPERLVLIDSKPYLIPKGMEIKHGSALGFPIVVANTARRTPSDRTLIDTAILKSPYSIGLLNATGIGGLEINRIWDERNINALFPGRITLGPLRQTTTITGFPNVFTVRQTGGFTEGLANLFIFGSTDTIGSVEPIWYFVASTTTWTNATYSADLGITADTIVAGVVQVGATVFAASRLLHVSGGGDKYTALSTTLAAWSYRAAGANSESLPSSFDRLAFLGEHNNELYSVGFINASGNAGLIKRDVTTTGALTWTAVGNTVSGANGTEPRGFAKWHDRSNATDFFFTTAIGLYWVDISAGTTSLVWPFRNPRGSYTGFLAVGPDDAIYFADGPNVGRFTWTDAGQRVDYIGPSSFDDPDILWDGLPADKQGDVTCLARSNNRPWLYVGVGGLTSTTNAWIGIYNVKTGRWNCPYRGGTAQRAILGLFESAQDDGVVRLHVAENNTSSAGGDQDPVFFERITSNPASDTAYKFAASGVITTSWFDAGFPVAIKGFLTDYVVAEGLTTDETIAFKFATNGGALGASQTIDSTTSPPRVFTDGAGAVGTAARRIQMEITLARGGTNTNSPKLIASQLSYFVRAGLKEDDTAAEEFEVPIELNPRAYRGRGTGRKSLHDIINTLIDLTEAGTLKTIVYGPDTGGINKKLLCERVELRETPPLSNPQSQGQVPHAIAVLVGREVV